MGISFLVMYFVGVDSNIMSLAGIAIAIGDVCDMGLIMTENIYRTWPTTTAQELLPWKRGPSRSARRSHRVSNTIVSFILAFALPPRGKLFGPLAHTGRRDHGRPSSRQPVPTSYYLLGPPWAANGVCSSPAVGRRMALVAGVSDVLSSCRAHIAGWSRRRWRDHAPVDHR
jgi:hypothetical protein